MRVSTLRITRQSLLLVGVKQRQRRLSLEHQGQLPRKVDHILDAGVHALGAGRTVDVRGIAAEQQAADPEARHHPAVDAEPGTPGHVPESRRDVRALIVDCLQFLDRGHAVVARLAERVAGDQAETPLADGKESHESMLGRENV